MASFISFQPSDFFNTTLYAGTGSSNAVTGVGFQPNLTWLKNRPSNYVPILFDSQRGVEEQFVTSSNSASSTESSTLTAWSSDGFTVNSSNESNRSGDNFVSWNWKMGTTTGIDTTGSDITPTSYSFNQSTGQSIILYPGSGSDHLLPHGLGKAPQLAIIKAVNGTTYWMCYSEATGNAKEFYLNGESAAGSSTTWNTTTPTTVNISLDPGAGNGVNASGTNYVGYFFTSIRGYSQINQYRGNGNADGPCVYTGFRPAFIIIKNTDTTSGWYMYDNKRPSVYNPNATVLLANSSSAESTNTASGEHPIDFLSNGFKIRTTSSARNGSGNKILYMAFAEFPFVSSNSKSGTAR